MTTMIELRRGQLEFTFPEVHDDARLTLDFQRTLRIPDDDRVHWLPPGLGRFPLRHVDDFADRVPAAWKEHGGVMMPMWQSEAMWIGLWSAGLYPCLVKVATGRINAVTGEPWRAGAHRNPQDYLVVPGQPWLDGYCVKKGEIRQFVAMPLGEGYTAEEQITGEAAHGGLQVVVHPMKAERWEKLRKDRPALHGHMMLKSCKALSVCAPHVSEFDMGLAPGGRMKQEIFTDPHDLDAWDLRHGSRCFVHIANSWNWRAVTGDPPPTLPPTARQYEEAGLPWFDYYGDGEAVEGSGTLAGLKSVHDLGAQKGADPLPENEPFDPDGVPVVKLGDRRHVVREGKF